MMLVTGATSAVGTAVIEELLARKIPVRAFVHQPSAAERLEAQGAEAFVGDMTERASTQQALQGIERVYLISPPSEQLFAIEHLWAEEARQAGIHSVIKQSEIGADPQSFSPLLQQHGKAEEAIRTSGVPYTILRTLYLMQNFGPMYAQSIRTRGMIFAPLANARISYVDARDVGAVAAQLLTEEGHQDQEYEVTGPEALSCGQLAEIFSTLLDVPVRYTAISDEEAQQAFLKRYSAWATHAVLTLLQFYRQGGGASVTRVIEDVTAHKPCTVVTYLTEHLQTFQTV
jgi:uncharacterized protein YbjT (DUF2867 family)